MRTTFGVLGQFSWQQQRAQRIFFFYSHPLLMNIGHKPAKNENEHTTAAAAADAWTIKTQRKLQQQRTERKSEWNGVHFGKRILIWKTRINDWICADSIISQNVVFCVCVLYCGARGRPSHWMNECWQHQGNYDKFEHTKPHWVMTPWLGGAGLSSGYCHWMKNIWPKWNRFDRWDKWTVAGGRVYATIPFPFPNDVYIYVLCMCVVRALANGISDELFPNSILIHALMKIEYICAYTIQHFFFLVRSRCSYARHSRSPVADYSGGQWGSGPGLRALGAPLGSSVYEKKKDRISRGRQNNLAPEPLRCLIRH